MKVEHILLDYSQHFIVVDGTRGPVCQMHNAPATHPSGVIRFRHDATEVAAGLRGAVFTRVADAEVEDVAPSCEPADKAWDSYVEIRQTCAGVITARYPEAAP